MKSVNTFAKTNLMKTVILFLLLVPFAFPAFSESPTDSIPPSVDTIINTGPNQIDIYFTEPLSQPVAENPIHYTLLQSNNHPTYVINDVANQALVHLVFSDFFSERVNYDIQCNGIMDLSSNLISDTIVRFVLYKPMPYDIIIDEIMADPSPSNGLPDLEWLEIRNVSPFDINLSGWRLAKSSGKSGTIRSLILKPDSMLVICSTGSLTELSVVCKSVSVTSFPSLSNTGDLICLLAPDGRTIHAVNYSDEWYHNELKKQGGWSLEMIDINNPCTGIDNWSSSVNIIGATPGIVNSIDAINIDGYSPKLMRAYATDSLHVFLYFNEPMDSLEAMNINHFHIDNNIGLPVAVLPIAPLFDKVKITLSHPITDDIIYNVTVDGVKDCILNTIGMANTARFGLDNLPDSFDIVVNEIIFNPKNDGVDYIELYNRSNKIINLKNIHIANLNTFGDIDNIVFLPDDGYLFFPQQYLLFTTNSSIVKRDYISHHPENIIQIDELPSMNDDEGNVILLNQQGSILDWLAYKDNWQFKLIDNTEGVALERIDYNGKTQNETNWHSAAATTGFGTPADKNSQCIDFEILKGEINIEPKVISPDNDGRDDIATIYYSFPDPGYMANITIFDISGKAIKHLQMNTLCGIKGSYRWDGLDDKNRKIFSGNYIILTEVFNLKGDYKKFKNLIAVRN